MEGFSGAVKAVIRQSRAGALRGIHGVLSQLITVEDAHSTAIEVALGAAYTHGGFAGRRWLTWGLERLMTLIVEGHLHPPDIEVIPFEEIPGGLERLAAGKVDGKLVANLRWR